MSSRHLVVWNNGLVWAARSLACLCGTAILVLCGEAVADDQAGVLSGTYAGPMTIGVNTRLSGVVNGDVTVLTGARLELSGLVTGRLSVQKGGRAIVSGIVNGTVENDGGYVEISGIYGTADTFDAGETRIAPTAVIAASGSGAEVSVVASIGTMEQFKGAAPDVRSAWALWITDQAMVMSPESDFVIRPIRADYAKQLEACIEAGSNKGTSLLDEARDCSTRLAAERVAVMKKESPQKVAEFLKRQQAAQAANASPADEPGPVRVADAGTDQIVTLPNGKKVRLREDGTYQVEGESAGYSEISILDLKVDLKALNGKLVKTKGRGTYFADELILTDPNGINVAIDQLSRDDRKWIVANCADGCSVVVEGKVDSDSFLPMLTAHAITHQ